MYFPSAQACSETNSGSPMPAAAIAAQNLRVARRGVSFRSGNAVLDGLMAGLTPPVPRPSCGDLQNSRGLYCASPFPEPGGGPAPTVESFSDPAALAAWLSSWQASAAAAEANANDGAIPMPTVGGPISGVSAPVAVPAPSSSGLSGLGAPFRRGGYGGAGYGGRQARFRRLGGPRGQGVGLGASCVNPTVLPLETVFPVNPSATAGAAGGSKPAAASSAVWWVLGFLALGALALTGDS